MGSADGCARALRRAGRQWPRWWRLSSCVRRGPRAVLLGAPGSGGARRGRFSSGPPRVGGGGVAVGSRRGPPRVVGGARLGGVRWFAASGDAASHRAGPSGPTRANRAVRRAIGGSRPFRGLSPAGERAEERFGRQAAIKFHGGSARRRGATKWLFQPAIARSGDPRGALTPVPRRPARRADPRSRGNPPGALPPGPPPTRPAPDPGRPRAAPTAPTRPHGRSPSPAAADARPCGG